MPGHYAAVMGRLAEQLIVPEANCSPQELRRGNRKGGVPEQVVKTGCYTPCAQRMEQDVIRVVRFV